VSVHTVLAQIADDERLASRLTHWRRLPPRPARYADWPPGLDPRLVAALREQGIERLYSHQAAAVEAALRGENVVIVTPTASGKTLAYNLPVLDALLRDPAARTLYLFPTKALAQDQQAALRSLLTPSLSSLLSRLAVYDGDTPRSARSRIRKTARLLISNPDMLHAGILPHHTRWAAFFRGLRYIVLDEIHTYRGIFGSHVANVLRRLKRICTFYGAAPRFLCTSATVANPLELAERLTEEPFTLIGPEQNGAPEGHKHFLFYNPPLLDRELGIRRSPATDARFLASRFLAAGVQTILFTRSRLTTELLLTALRNAVADEGLTPEQVQGYRGGYLPTERRRIEEGLRRGQVRAVVATNALELGIDIGRLDACLMVGYPGTIASTWQQAGRAGRRAAASVAVLLAGASPLDQYIIRHPDYFFGRPPERALLNPDNPVIALAHLRCAAFELPFEEGESLGRFPHTQEALAFLAEEGLLRFSRGRWHYAVPADYPAGEVGLRTAGADTFAVVDMSREGAVVGLVDGPRAPAVLHEGAIYLHGGATYLVRRLDWEGRRAEVEPVQADYYTQAGVSTTVAVIGVAQEAVGPTMRKACGRVRITSQVTGYKKVRLSGHEILGWGEIPPESLPPQEMETMAYWFSIAPQAAARLEEEGLLDPRRGDRGPNWERQRNRARARDGYRCRHCGAPERPGRAHHVHHIRPFRTFGYVRGENENYLEANRLSNLITLCPTCHRRVEVDRAVRSALSGLAHALRHLAPLYLMCDPRDLGVVSELRSPQTKGPTITIYDNAPGGLGFAPELYERHDTLLVAARDLVWNCGCRRGCPSCVGPAEGEEDAKANCLRLLEVLTEMDLGSGRGEAENTPLSFPPNHGILGS